MIPNPFTYERDGPCALVEGYFLIKRWRSGRVPIPVRIWFGTPCDPDTGDEMDRAPRWQIMIGGVMLDHEPVQIAGRLIESIDDFWPACAAEPIDRIDHDFMVARAAWAGEHDENDPFGSTTGRIDPMTAPLPFME